MPVGQAEGDPQADQGDRALAAAEATQAGGRQAGDGRLAGADVDHLADPVARSTPPCQGRPAPHQVEVHSRVAPATVA